ncbi:hypothetical protein BHE74_00039279, partial [Ensete ventricosum]
MTIPRRPKLDAIEHQNFFFSMGRIRDSIYGGEVEVKSSYHGVREYKELNRESDCSRSNIRLRELDKSEDKTEGREENRRWWLKLQPINHESPLL